MQFEKLIRSRHIFFMLENHDQIYNLKGEERICGERVIGGKREREGEQEEEIKEQLQW